MAQAKKLTEAQWKARADAQVLMEANEILKSKPRMLKAKTAAKSLVQEKKSEVASLQKVATKKPMNHKKQNRAIPNKKKTSNYKSKRKK